MRSAVFVRKSRILISTQASLNQLVDLSRIEAGQTEVFQEFSLRETVREYVRRRRGWRRRRR